MTTTQPTPTARKTDRSLLRMARILRELDQCREPELVYLAGRINELLGPTSGAPGEE
jgi:hypothetical protein